MTIHAVLADDEVLARQKLRQLLRGEPEVDIVGECATAPETIELVRATRLELLFLDIRMPGMDGFDVVGALSASNDFAMPSIVFTAAYDQYAPRAFEIHAVDYLLKPFTSERLHSAITRVIERTRHPELIGDKSNGALRSSTPYSSRIIFKSRGSIIFLPVSEIRWIAAEENYVRICTERENHLLRETMAHLERRLDPETFLRVHRSAIVNLRYVKEIRSELTGDFTVVLVNGQKVAMSRSYRSRVSEWMVHG